jgi:hypothetical protein
MPVKLTVAQLQKKFLLLTWIQKVYNRIHRRSANKSYPEPDEFSAQANIKISSSSDHFFKTVVPK